MYSKSIIFKQTNVSKFTWFASVLLSSLRLPLGDRTDHLSDTLLRKLASHDKAVSVRSPPLSMTTRG